MKVKINDGFVEYEYTFDGLTGVSIKEVADCVAERLGKPVSSSRMVWFCMGDLAEDAK